MCCRDRYRDNGSDIEINPYYQGFLNEEDTRWIAGYDWAVSQSLDGYFENIDESKLYLETVLSSLGNIDVREVSSSKPVSLYSDTEINSMSKLTLALKTIREDINCYFESERDSLIEALIDNMPKAEYEEIRNRVILNEFE